MKKHTNFHKICSAHTSKSFLTTAVFALTALSLLNLTIPPAFAQAAPATDKLVTGTMTPEWPRTTVARQQFNFNQNWQFFLPPVPASQPPYLPPAGSQIGQGDFAPGAQAQDVILGEHTSRYVVLESLSSQSDTAFASIAEFWLLDAKGQPLPRSRWQAFADSDDKSSGDVAANAIDGDPATKWHSRWNDAQPPQPHRLIIDMGQATKFFGFRMQPRSDGNPVSNIKAWRFYATDHGPASLTDPAIELIKADDSKWQTVNLPHTVRLEPLNASGGRNYQGICWYRKHFPLEASWQKRKLSLRFEGAMQVADIWLNGKHLLTHYGGYLPFVVDLGPAAHFGSDNVLTVRLDNSDNPEVPPGKPQAQLDFAYFGGLYRGVQLEVINPLHITDPMLANTPAGGGVFVTYPEVSTAVSSVQVRTDVANEDTASRECLISQELIAPDGSVAATASGGTQIGASGKHTFIQTLAVHKAKLWHPYHPWLYVLHTVISDQGHPVDDTWTRLGIRSIRFDKNLGMILNGEPFFSSGANRHQDHPYVGYALPASAQYRDVKKLRDAGFTSYRSHYPQSPDFMDACDELGMLAIVSNPGWQFMGDAVFKERVYQNAREMVRRDRNHPSVILWEAQLNETDNRPVAPTLQRIIHEEYPGDQCYTAGDRTVTPGFSGWDVDYNGNNGDKPGWWREWGDQVDNWGEQQGSSRVARGWGETPMLVQVQNHLTRWDEVLEYNAHTPAPDRGRLGGACIWAGIDCYRGYHHQPFYGSPLDLFRLPKFDYYFMQSQRPTAIQVPGVEGGPMVFIANFATFHSPTTVTVFSNCDSVRLIQDGKVIGLQTPDTGHRAAHPPFTFHASQVSTERSMLFASGVNKAGVEAGELKAEGLIDGKVAATFTIHSPGVPTHLELQTDYAGRGLTADGSDWIRVYARICDSRGTTYPYGDDMITFQVDGPGEVIGDASIGANPVRAEAGIATVLLRAGKTPGTITLHADAFGLTSASIQITSQPSQSQMWPPNSGK